MSLGSGQQHFGKSNKIVLILMPDYLLLFFFFFNSTSKDRSSFESEKTKTIPAPEDQRVDPLAILYTVKEQSHEIVRLPNRTIRDQFYLWFVGVVFAYLRPRIGSNQSSNGWCDYLRLSQMIVRLEILSPRPILIVRLFPTNKISRTILWDGLRCFVSTALKSIAKPWKICVQLLLWSTAASGFWTCSKIVVALPTTDFARVTVHDL